MVLYQVYIVLLTILINNTVTAFIKNKYNIEVDNVDLCPNNDKLPMPISNLKYVRYNRTQKALSYDFIYDRPIDERVGGSITMERWGDGGWKSIPFIGYQADMCKSMITYFKEAWVSFHKNAGVKRPERCPVPPGNYSVKNYVVQTSSISIPFWSGRFRLNLMYVDAKTKEPLYCYIYYVKIEEMV